MPTLVAGSGDREVRLGLIAMLESATCPHRILQEFWIPLSHERADVVDVNGQLCAYEIKSALDDLTRLERQVGAFNRIFDRMTAVVASRHLKPTSELLPHWWGIVEVVTERGTMTFRSLRKPGHNPLADPSIQVRLLWRRELVPALRDLGVTGPERLSRPQMWSQLQTLATTRHLRTIVRRALLARDTALRRW
jgi:hypothetical protein